jgi:aryl-alcohol dehydrogenase-like predicted oxidoreductase
MHAFEPKAIAQFIAAAPRQVNNAYLAGLLMYLNSLDFIESGLRNSHQKIGRIEMNKRKLGNTGLEISPLVFGGNVFGWTTDEPTSFNLLDAFIAAGFNAIDTADVYSKWAPGHTGGESETILGKWIKRSGNRDKVILATKVGLEMGPGQKGLSRSHILRSVENSLRRLQTHYIDLYQSHTDDPDTPIEETLGAYAELIAQGKVRAIGASNYKGDRLAAALEASKKLGLPRYQSLQPNYNLYDRAEYEPQLEPLCVKEGLGVINYFPLAAGFLSGKYRSEADVANSARAGMVKKYFNERGLKILQALDEVAKKYNATPARVSLAWLLARPSITAPIVSATNLKQLSDLIASVELTLDRASIELLNQASAYAANSAS